MNDPSYPAPPPEPTPPPTLVVRLALAVALVIGFVMVQNIAVFGLIVVSKVTGIGDIDVTSLMKGKGSTAELLVLALSDLIAAAVLVLGTVAVKQSLAAMALRWRGGMRSFLYTVPVLVIGVALPTIGNVAAHHRFAAANVDLS
ncbi:MAG: hypothetical protein H7123_01820, partial [Thermoleophilia bacterium]|nr:hypothetical protein [Thermoleophilia bacterium]